MGAPSGEAVTLQEGRVDAGSIVGAEQTLDVARHDIDFDVDRVTGLARVKTGVRHRVRNQVDTEARTGDFVDSQARAVDGHRPLVSDVASQCIRHGENPALRTPVILHGHYLAQTVDM